MLNAKCQHNLVKKIGNVVFLLFATLQLSINAKPHVELLVTSAQGDLLEEVAAGVPFTIQVNVIDGENNIQMPKIHGIDEFVQGHVRTASRFTTINGATTSTRSFYFSVRADEQGSYTIGPAQVRSRSDVLSSDVVAITVGSHERKKGGNQHDETEAAQLTLSVNKKEIWPGEPLKLTVRFVYDPEIQLTSQPAADFKKEGWLIRSQSQPQNGQEIINGKKYAYSEQEFEMYNYEPGSHIIPALSATCLIPVKASRGRLDFDFFDIGDFFGRHKEQQTIQSNAVTVNVKQLAHNNEHTHGIARITQAKLSADHTTAKEGEGVVVKLELDGWGDAIGLQAPQLVLPDAFNYYESKTDIKDNAGGGTAWKKVFEYIVQAHKSGTFKLPAQVYTFFDYEHGAYTKVTTNSLEITITPGNSSVPSSGINVHTTPSIDTGSAQETIHPIYQGSQWYAQSRRMIPYYIFMALLILLIIAIIIALMWYFSDSYRLRFMKDSKRKYALKNARVALKNAKKNQDTTRLYAIALTFFADRFERPLAEVTENSMKHILLDARVAQHKIKQWSEDVAILAERAYFNSPLSSEEALKLFELLEQWLEEFERSL